MHDLRISETNPYEELDLYLQCNLEGPKNDSPHSKSGCFWGATALSDKDQISKRKAYRTKEQIGAALLLGFLALSSCVYLCGVTLNFDSNYLQVPHKLS